MRWETGDELELRAHYSKPGKGLSYGAGKVRAVDPGCAGGWDVYDALGVEGNETSFYGLSVVRVLRRARG